MSNWQKSGALAFGIGFVIFLIGTWLEREGFNRPASDLITSFAIYELYSFTIYFINVLYFSYIGQKYNGANELKKRIILGFSGSFVLSLIALVFLRFVVKVYFFGGDPQKFLENSKGYFFFSIAITLLVNLVIYVFYFYKAITEKKVTESQVVAKTETAKYESLKSQLDPHFLFNSLNVLTSLISENPKLAEKFTTKLSKVYRYVLEQKNKDLIPLQEELDFAKTYMELLKMRFEDGVDFELPETASHEDLKIVPLSLQILLENAVKHNIISTEEPLMIRIYESGGRLVVENSLNKKNHLEKSTKLGLKNIIDRYGLITKKPVSILEENKNFKVSLPLLTQKIKVMETNRFEESRYLRAKQKVEEIKGFYGSLVGYVIVMPFLFYIWHTYTPFTIQWFWFPMLGWGMGLVFQGLHAFGTPILGRDWEERKIREIMKDEEKTFWE